MTQIVGPRSAESRRGIRAQCVANKPRRTGSRRCIEWGQCPCGKQTNLLYKNKDEAEYCKAQGPLPFKCSYCRQDHKVVAQKEMNAIIQRLDIRRAEIIEEQRQRA